MQNSPTSRGLTSDQVARFTAARERFKTISGESSTSAATTPSGGTPDGAVGSSTSLTSLLEGIDDRLIHLAHAERPEGGPPLDVYRTTPSEHGDVVTATPEFVAYMRRTFPGYGVGVHSALPAPGRQDPGVGASKRPRYQKQTP
jgi:hypothetical protein